MAGWPKPLCGESLSVNTVNHNHTFNSETFSKEFGKEFGDVLFDVALGRDEDFDVPDELKPSPPARRCVCLCMCVWACGIQYAGIALEFRPHS